MAFLVCICYVSFTSVLHVGYLVLIRSMILVFSGLFVDMVRFDTGDIVILYSPSSQNC